MSNKICTNKNENIQLLPHSYFNFRRKYEQTLLQSEVRRHSSFFQNEDIFIQLDELDELDRITHA